MVNDWGHVGFVEASSKMLLCQGQPNSIADALPQRT